MPVKIFNVGEYRRQKGFFSMRDIDNEEEDRNKCNAEVDACPPRPLVVYTLTVPVIVGFL